MSIDLSVPIWTIEHIAAALHLSVDAARDYTYRADFPPAPGQMLLVRRDAQQGRSYRPVGAPVPRTAMVSAAPSRHPRSR